MTPIDDAPAQALDSAHRRTPLLLQMSISLVDTFNRCRAARDAALPAPPAPVAIPVAMPPQTRRVLTKKSEPAGNSGLDNEDRNLIVHVRDVLGVSDSHRGYLVLELLGQGTFGQVFRCQNLETKEMVAVKVIRNHPSYYKQAIVEVQITGLLNRKYTAEEGRHMVRLRDSFSYQSHLCLVFELLSINVYELIAENKFRGFPLSITRGLLEQMLHALVQFEDAGVIHCDLKPENILVAGRDEYFESPGHGVGQPHVPFIKIVDFGSACLENETVYSYIQSRFYRSPEVLLGIPYNSAIDMWSLGCIAFEMFLGLPLFPGVSEHDQLRLIEETLGCIPQRLVRRGRNVLKFYDVRADELNNSPYRREEFVLKTPEQFAKENNTEVKISKKYFKHDKLAEMIQAYPLDTTRTEEEQAQEQEQRRSFVHFVSCLLELDPQLRWTAREAVRHPFIAGTPFHPTRSTDAYAFQQEVGSPAAVMPFSPSVGGCSLEHLRSLHSSEVSKPGGLSVYSPARTGGEVGTNLDHSTAWGSGSQPLWGCALFDYRLPPHESSTQATKLLSSPYKHAALDVISQPYFSQAFHLPNPSTLLSSPTTALPSLPELAINSPTGTTMRSSNHRSSRSSRVVPLASTQMVFPAESYPWMYSNRCEFGASVADSDHPPHYHTDSRAPPSLSVEGVHPGGEFQPPAPNHRGSSRRRGTLRVPPPVGIGTSVHKKVPSDRSNRKTNSSKRLIKSPQHSTPCR